MGILGAASPESMLQRLRNEATAWEMADPSLTVLKLGWAEPDSLLLFRDIQPGRSPVLQEARAYREVLSHPRVHLALDPEFAMGPQQVPGRQIGSLGADAVNEVIAFFAELVEEKGIPPKILAVHRFTAGMLRGAPEIRRDPRVQVVLSMDGIGAPPLRPAPHLVIYQ